MPDTSRSRMPSVLRAPLDGRTWRAVAHHVTSLPVAVVAFALAVPLSAAGAGLAVTFLGLPVLAALFVTARGFAAMERGRANALVDAGASMPAPRVQRTAGLWGWMANHLADGADWRSLLYMVVLLPWSIFTFTTTVVFELLGWSLLLYPAWQWVFPRFLDEPGMPVYGDAVGHQYYADGALGVWGLAAVGLVLVVITPWIVRGLAAVDAVLVRGLLGRGLDDPGPGRP